MVVRYPIPLPRAGRSIVAIIEIPLDAEAPNPPPEPLLEPETAATPNTEPLIAPIKTL